MSAIVGEMALVENIAVTLESCKCHMHGARTESPRIAKILKLVSQDQVVVQMSIFQNWAKKYVSSQP